MFMNRMNNCGKRSSAMKKKKTPVRKIGVKWRRQLLRVAAVVMISLLTVLLYDKIKGPEQQNIAEKNKELLNVNPEMIELIEAEAYYSSEVNNKMEELNSFRQKEEYAEILKDLEKDFSELDSAYMELKKELTNDVFSEEIVESMIENYRIKLDVLEDVLSEIRKSKRRESRVEHKSKMKSYEI